MEYRKTITLILLLSLAIGIFIPTQTAKAEPYKKIDQFYDYDSVATINGTWGANLFINNDSNKQFDRILPKDTQWQIYGYTKRKDGFYYWAGGNQWIQANQAIVHVDNKSDAILNVIAKYGDSNDPDTWWLSDQVSNGYWGTDYWRVKEMTIIGVSYKYQYVVYPDGSSYRLNNSDNPM